MALTVNLKTQSGLNYSRKFNPGDGVSIYGKATGILGLGEPGTHVRFSVLSGSSTIYFKETYTDIWGDYSFYYTMPLNNAKLDFVLIASYSVYGQDQVKIPVAVGYKPDPLPLPEGEGLPWWVLPSILLIGTYVVLKDKL
ncbi:MAG TPA: hypothetical protein ENO18_04345 [Caldithrix sp.]|nr:hypothetical protein [Caldithrix sp.]